MATKRGRGDAPYSLPLSRVAGKSTVYILLNKKLTPVIEHPKKPILYP
jgi:hypothetical protein